MNELEQRLADAVRRNGDILFSELPDWPNSVITVGEGNLRVHVDRLKSGPKMPPVFRHELHVPLEGLVRVDELVGRQTLGRVVLIDAKVIAERPADGPVIGVRGLRRWYNQIGRSSFLLMKSPMGLPLIDRWSTMGNAERRCVGDIRRHMREWVARYEDADFRVDRLILDQEDADLDRPTHVDCTSGYVRLERDGLLGWVDVGRAADGKWLGSSPGRILDFVRRYEAGPADTEAEEDPDDAFLEGAFA